MEPHLKGKRCITISFLMLFIIIFSLQPTILEPIFNPQHGLDFSITFQEATPTINSITNNSQLNSELDGQSGTRARYLEHIIDLDDPTVQLTVQSGDAYDTSYGSNIRSGTAIAAGDIDNDGYEDLIMGCPFGDGALEDRYNTGQVLVIFGGTQTHPNTIYDQARYTPGEIDIAIHGADNNDLLGGAVVCGDVDGDAYDDIIISAPYSDSVSNSRNDAGEVCVIFGDARDKLESVIDLRTTEPDLLIFGARNSDLAGFSLALGDVIGDNKLDIIIGAKLADPEGRTNAGMVYIIAGNTRANFGKTIDLDLLTGSGRGPRGIPDVRIDGVSPDDRAGFAVAAGDVNGDGRDDVIIGARLAQYNSSWDNTGVTYVIYGQQTLPNKINLTVDADVYIYGLDSQDNSGWALATGDINGDTIDDLIIGAPYADGFNNGQRDAGEIYIVYGSNALAQNIFTRLDGHDVIAYGVDAWDNFGFSVATGSVDGDEFADFIMGARGGNGEFNGKGDCGDTYLITGNTSARFGDDIDLITESRTLIYGIDVGDNSGRFIHFGDLDGDGLEDIILGAPFADGPDNARDSCGEFYVIYSAPPPVKNEALSLVDGDYNQKTIFTRYKPYSFKVNVSNILGYKDIKSVTLSIDPEGFNITYRWVREFNEFFRMKDTYGFVECVSGFTDVNHDGFYNYSIDFKFNFNWNFSTDGLINCQVTTEGLLSYPDTDIFLNVFELNNQLVFKGELKVFGALQGKLNPGDWVRGEEKITFTGLTVAYNSTQNYYPPNTEYSLGIETSEKTWVVTTSAAGEPFTAMISAPAETTQYYYQPRILGIPPENYHSNINITFLVDSDPPEPPIELIIKADSQEDLDAAVVDNDNTFFISWSEAQDNGAGIKGYFHGFSDQSGTENGIWTEKTTAKLVDASEGLNSIYVWSMDNVGNIGTNSNSQIFIDLTEATFENFTPVIDKWLTHREVNCSIQVFDLEGYGVDIENITYLDMNSKKWLPVNIDVYDNQSFSFANVSVVATLTEGTDSYIQFRAIDRAGNGPAESERFKFEIDTTPVEFSKAMPNGTQKQTSPKIRCYVTLTDRGSGIDLASIQYSFTTSGVANFSQWSNSGLAILADPKDPEGASTWFIDLTLARGGENYIRWRAKDLAGNGYTESDEYSIWVNALPNIIIEGVVENGVYETSTFIEFNADKTVDPDDTLQDKNFVWHSNITGDIGIGKIVEAALPPGRHLISLSVFDGQNYARNQFNITVLSPKAPETDEDNGVFGISKDADSVIISLIILIIIIIILFLIVFLREKKIRKRLEEKALGAGAITMARPTMIGRDSPQLMSPGGPSVIGTGSGVGSEPAPITGLKGPQQLPKVGGTEAEVETGEGAAVTGPGTIGRQLPQLPPARFSGYPFPQRKPDMKVEIDTRKKMELLEKKMLVGEIPVGLYEKLSKKYEEELKTEKERKAKEAEEKEKTKTDDSNLKKPVIEPNPKPTLASVGVTPDKQEEAKKLEEENNKDKANTPEPESPDEPEIKPTVTPNPTSVVTFESPEQENELNLDKDIETNPTITGPQLVTVPKSKEPDVSMKKKKKKKKAGFEQSQGFSEEELGFLRKLKKDE